MKPNLSSAVALLMLASPAFAASLTLVQVERDIRVHGARETVKSLARKEKFNAVLDRIATGNEVWVRLAPELARGTDVGDSTALTVALAMALPKNPTAVIAVLGKGPVIGPAAVCSVPFVETTPQEVHEYLDRAIPAVSHVEPSSLVRRAACLEALHQAQDQISQHP